MGIVQRFERKLEGAVGDAFARVFGGGVVPHEVEQALQREATDRVQQLDGGHWLAPNAYVITINSSDHPKLSTDRDLSVHAFAKHLGGFIRDNGWQTYGDINVRFEPSPDLHTGQFRIRGSVDPDAVPTPSSASTSHKPGAGPMSQNSGYDQNSGPAHNAPRKNGADQYGGWSAPPRDQDAENGRGADQGYAGGYAQPGYHQPHDEQSAQDQHYGGQAYSDQGYADRGYADQGRYLDKGSPDQGGYGGHPGYPAQQPAQQPGYNHAYQDQGYANPGYPDQGGYGDKGYAAQQPGYDQAYGTQAADPGYDQAYGAAPYAGEPTQAQSYGQGGPSQASWATRAMTATLQLEDGSGRNFQLREGINVIGRGQDAEFRLPDTGVSRRHVEIRWDGQIALLTDLGSTNGTTVNGAPVQDWQLADGDIIRAGHSEIVVRIQ